MLGVITIAVIAILILLWYFFIRPNSYWTRLGVKQSKPWILFGDSWHTFLKQSSINDFVQKYYNMHPGTRYSGFYDFRSPTLLIRDPELIKQITVKDFEHFTDHPSFIEPEADPLWCNNLFALQGERWKEIRHTLSPAFTSSKVKGIYVLMMEIAENFLQHLMEKEDKIIELEVKDTYTRFANDVIATTAFGVQVNSLKDKNNIFYEMGHKLTNFRGYTIIIKFIGLSLFPKLYKYLGIPFLNKQASKYFYAIMDETIKEREQKNIVRPDMLNILLEARKENAHTNENSDTGTSKGALQLSNEEITSQAMIFFFAGFDTVSTAMCFGSYELALDKDVQDRLREEINKTQKDGKVTYEELMQMKYMDMVVSEILRKWPPFSMIDRMCTKPYTIKAVNKDEKPVPIKLKQEIWLPVYGLHRDPKWFSDPDKFDPERFSDKNKNKITPYTYIPFGVGPRSCIGNRFALLEVKALLFNLLLHYEIVPTKKTQVPLVIPKGFSQIPEEGIWLGLKRIK